MITQNPCRYCVAAVVRKKRHVPSFTVECQTCNNRKEYEKYLESNRLFEPGDPITDLQTLLQQEWVIWHGATKHVETFRSMTVRTVEGFLKSGAFRRAVKKDDI